MKIFQKSIKNMALQLSLDYAENKPCVIRNELLQRACGYDLRKNDWLQNGYKIPEEPADEAKYVDHLDEKRIKSAFYYHISRVEAGVGFGQHRTFAVWHIRPSLCGLLCGFCSLVREFARRNPSFRHPTPFRFRLMADPLAFGSRFLLPSA